MSKPIRTHISKFIFFFIYHSRFNKRLSDELQAFVIEKNELINVLFYNSILVRTNYDTFETELLTNTIVWLVDSITKE